MRKTIIKTRKLVRLMSSNPKYLNSAWSPLTRKTCSNISANVGIRRYARSGRKWASCSTELPREQSQLQNSLWIWNTSRRESSLHASIFSPQVQKHKSGTFVAQMSLQYIDGYMALAHIAIERLVVVLRAQQSSHGSPCSAP